jgi:cellulose 1,4-beta-cellobiosidase
MAQVADYPTAVWLDDIAAITTGRGLAGHLDEALRQGADLVQLVIYNLPNRDCHGEGANGEVPVAAGGQQRYQTDYIDPIVEILSRPEYADLRLVAVVEPGALVTQVIYSPPMTGRPAVPGDVRGGCLCGGDPVRGER